MAQISVWTPGANRRTQEMYGKMTDEQRATENQHAARLRAQSAALLAGPKLDGNVIIIPSWAYKAEAVREWKARGGAFHDGCQFTATVTVAFKSYTETISLPAWTIPARRAGLAEITAIYTRCFCREIALAESAARMLR